MYQSGPLVAVTAVGQKVVLESARDPDDRSVGPLPGEAAALDHHVIH